MVIGIDIGGSTTKIVGLKAGKLISPLIVRANDPIASLFGAFGKFVDQNRLALSEVKQVMVTGVGASFAGNALYGLPTGKVEEFFANGQGGLLLSGLDEALIVSMGTGTALVRAGKDKIFHVGGTAIGGGTILGLSNRMLNIRDISLLIKMAEGGMLENIDLLVQDITRDTLPTLPPGTTASNFGKISDVASNADIALGILNMVFQAIGMSAALALRNDTVRDVVCIGKLSTIPQAQDIFRSMEKLFDVKYIIPENAEFATAVGAALAFEQGHEFKKL